MGPAGQAKMHFAVAESGSAVYAVGSLGGLAEVLVTVGLDRGEHRIRGFSIGNYSGPRFDPTGRYIAFEIDGTLWIRDLVLGSQTMLHEENAYNDSLIVYSGEIFGWDGAEIWYVSSTPPADPRPFLRADGFASLSPDGRWLAHESDVSDRAAVYVQSFPVPGGRRKVSEGGGVGARWAATERGSSTAAATP